MPRAVRKTAISSAIASRFEPRNDGASQFDPRTGLEWTTATIGEVSFAGAEKLAAGVRIGGHTDWRLPTVEELFCLADRSRQDPAIDTAAFPDTRSTWYWSSSPAAWSPADCAWLVGFSYGGAYHDGRGHGRCVRAVRSAAAPVQ